MKPFAFFVLPSACLLTLTLSAGPLFATGDYWLSPEYLEGDGKTLKAAPEFFWSQEIERLAAKYRDRESAGLKRKTSGGAKRRDFGNDEAIQAMATETAEADKADFEDALKSGRLKPADPEAARKAHLAARAAIDEDKPVPGGETNSEFADYHTGAAGPVAGEAAAAAWQKLLTRPKEQRHYRSVWAAFMLGKHALAKTEYAEAVKWFEQCRALAREGFADSLGLAADSIGWQGRAELLAEHYPQAARLYLTQLALGDESAVISLKRLIPEWMSPMSGGLPGEPLAEESPDAKKAEEQKPDEQKAAAEKAAAEAKAASRWTEAARDPVLQELVTAHILATNTGMYTTDDGRSRKWFEIIDKAGVKKVEDAVALAWVAYATGDYKASAAWLAKAESDSPRARWLKAKFALREGNFAAAAKLMEGVEDSIAQPKEFDSYSLTQSETAHGEIGALHYAKGEYAEALEEFRKGNCEGELKFMVESIMTPEELIAYAAKVPAPPKKEKKPVKEGEEPEEAEPVVDFAREFTEPQFVRSLIGRRLVREGKVKESRAFLSEDEQKWMDEYIAQVLKAEDKKTPAAERAKAWWEAGVMMKENGHYFRGTEADFHRPSEDVADYTVRTARLSGKSGGGEKTEDGEKEKGSGAAFIPVSKEEKKRLAATAKHHTKAMRTRIVGSNHLLAGAALLPKGSEEQARMLNTAGWWLQDADNPAADRIYHQVEKTCGNTVAGKAVIKKHWFLGEIDPWEKDLPEPE
ncbi:MAG TPA: hypothetical protein VG796_04370 [Verrucomicrobiales bacterium]|nr:hypothetical protein [Verrucomicrobiales bacterium]